MFDRDYTDMCSGAALIAIGGFSTGYAIGFLKLGTVSQMGPGMFPMALGVLLVTIGTAIAIPALFRSGEMPNIDGRALVVICLSIGTFACLLRPFGLVPASIVLVLIAGRSDGKLSLPRSLAFAAILALLVTGLFKFGLGMNIAVVNWPW